MELSDSEDEDEIRSNPGNGNGNGHGDDDDDLTQWTLDTFTSRPVGGDSAVNTVSSSTLCSGQTKLICRYVGCIPKWRNRLAGLMRL
jgi:hypothetical protein